MSKNDKVFPKTKFCLIHFAACLLSVSAFVITAPTALASTLTVPTQYPNLQAAVNSARSGDEIVVADGTYTGAANTNIDFLGKSLNLTGEHGAAKTIIDCQGSEDTPDVRALYFHNNEIGVVVKGITFTHATDRQGNSGQGGAVCVQSGSPKFVDCVFDANFALKGGGIYVAFRAKATCVGCSFTHNDGAGSSYINPDKQQGARAMSGRGGGAFVEGDTWFDRCTFSDNGLILPSTVNGGTAGGTPISVASGAAISTEYGNTHLTDCTFIHNASSEGGAIDCNGYLTMKGCHFLTNAATYEGGAIRNSGEILATDCAFCGNLAFGAGAIGLEGSSPSTFMNCLFAQNAVTGQGNYRTRDGAAVFVDAPASFLNCTITRNYALNNGTYAASALALSGPGNANFGNCIIYGNDCVQIAVGTNVRPPTLSHCDVQGTFPGDGNLDVDPTFVDAPGGDYGLKLGSKCLGRGLKSGKALSNVVGPTSTPLTTPKTTAPLNDYDGRVRPALPSIGAYEVGSAKTLLKVPDYKRVSNIP